MLVCETTQAFVNLNKIYSITISVHIKCSQLYFHEDIIVSHDIYEILVPQKL